MAQSQYSPPTSFHSSSLVRLLASLGIAPTADSTQTFAERLSFWVAWTDAITLSGTLGALGADAGSGANDEQVAPSARVASVVLQMQRVRKELTELVTKDTILSSANGGKSRSAAVAPGAADTGNVAEFDFAAYRRSFSVQQRTMEERIGALRVAVRELASQQSPALRQLAAIDAAMETALGAQQRRVMANVPALLEKRCKDTQQPLQSKPIGKGDAPPALTTKPPPGYGQTMQAALLAEMEVRLRPVEGMIDALGNRITGQT